MNGKTIVVIPARMGSTRFPGKPLALILGRPMLHWVIKHAIEAVGVSNTFVASCDTQILEFAESEGVKAVETSSDHVRASDRTHEAVEKILIEGARFENVVMLQGDEPTILSDDLSLAVAAIEEAPRGEIVNLMGFIHTKSELENPNTIKVVVRLDSTALYFSRSPLPYGASFGAQEPMKQVCAIGFSVQALRDFYGLEPAYIEQVESIDMLRWLANVRDVRMIPIKVATHPVDVEADIPIVEQLLSP